MYLKSLILAVGLFAIGNCLPSSFQIDQAIFQSYHSKEQIENRQKLLTNSNVNAENLSNDRLPDRINHPEIVRRVFESIDIDAATSFLTRFVDDHINRRYDTEFGEAASLSIYSQAQQAIATQIDYEGTASVSLMSHEWLQPSVIIRFEGHDPTLNDQVLILGAQIDSINSDTENPIAPGANDNGSGAATLYEIFRALLAANWVPKRAVEFQFYAASEVGLLGSSQIVESYSAKGINVHSMVNLLLVGNYADVDVIGFHTDFVDEELTQYLKLLVNEYLDFGYEDKGFCNYACSDHAFWNMTGYRTAFPIERFTQFDLLHSEQDTIEKVNFRQVYEFIKLGVSYIVEVAEPANA